MAAVFEDKWIPCYSEVLFEVMYSLCRQKLLHSLGTADLIVKDCVIVLFFDFGLVPALLCSEATEFSSNQVRQIEVDLYAWDAARRSIEKLKWPSGITESQTSGRESVSRRE